MYKPLGFLQKDLPENQFFHFFAGMAFQNLYHKCREAFLVNSDLTLQAQLVEFKDHRLIRSKKVCSVCVYSGRGGKSCLFWSQISICFTVYFSFLSLNLSACVPCVFFFCRPFNIFIARVKKCFAIINVCSHLLTIGVIYYPNFSFANCVDIFLTDIPFCWEPQ